MLLIVKPTYDCNARCRYCVYPEKEYLKRMNETTLSLLESRIFEFQDDTAANTITFLWHGGEPLLMGNDFFKAVEDMTQRLETRLKIKHLFQTNLTLLADREIPSVIQLMKKHQSVSTSFDPVIGIRELEQLGQYRKKWLKAFFRLKAESIYPNVVYVVHRQSLPVPEQILHFFRNLGVQSLRLNPVAIHTGKNPRGEDLAITSQEYAKFLVTAWHIWDRTMSSFSVDPFSSWARIYTQGGKPNTCAMNGKCSSNILCVDPQGAVYNCGRQIDCSLGLLGNITDNSLKELDSRRTPLARATSLRKGHCAHCRWWNYCRGGCPMDPAAAGLSPDEATVWCEAYQLFFEQTFGEVAVG